MSHEDGDSTTESTIEVVEFPTIDEMIRDLMHSGETWGPDELRFKLLQDLSLMIRRLEDTERELEAFLARQSNWD